MTIDLLAVVRAESEAEALVRNANSRRAQILREAELERERKLAAIVKEPVVIDPLPPLRFDAEKFKETARKNKTEAIKKILEELHAS